MIERIKKREYFSYGIQEIDDILSSHTGSAPAILYQETIMTLLNLAEIPVAETYTLLKGISAKKIEVINAAKEKVISGLAKRYSVDKNNFAIKSLWTQIENSGQYASIRCHSIVMC